MALQSVAGDIQCQRRLAEEPERRLTTTCPSTSVNQVGLAEQSFLHDCTDKLQGESCIAHCGFGFTMQEATPAIFLCQNAALVGSGLPTCVGSLCNFSFPTGLGVVHDCDGKRTGETCTASCGQAGYTYAANANAQQFTCLATQNFQGTAPTCTQIRCADLALGNNFFHNCQGKRFGETCGISCATGYHLNGWGSQLTCSADGTFSGSIPNCVGNPCSNSLTTDKTLLSENCTGLTTGQSCGVSCAPGFSANSSTLHCDMRGFLTGTPPICAPLQCAVPPALSNATLAHTCNQIAFNRSCAVTCAAGYRLASGSQQEWNCIWDGSGISLSGSLPSCEPEPCTSGLPPQSERTVENCTDLRTGESCLQSCADGYVGNASSFTCQSDGAARTQSAAQCQAMTCGLSLSDSSIGHTCTGISFGSSCSAFCNRGYSSSNGVQALSCGGPDKGTAVVNSQEAITLRGTLPICQAQACFYNFPTGSQFTHTCDGVKTGQQCTASCADGWDGSSTSLTCESQGGLNGSFPVCSLQTVTQTQTSTKTTTSTATSTMTDLEVRVNVAGSVRMEVNNTDEFISDPDVQQALSTVLAEIMVIPVQRLQLSLVLANQSGRLLAVGSVTAVYSAWLSADSQQQADLLGSNITSRLDAVSVTAMQTLIVDSLTQVSGKDYAIVVQSHNAEILVGTRRQEAVAKLPDLCYPSDFPVIVGRGFTSNRFS